MYFVYKNKKNSNGFSFIEVIIAMGVFLSLVVGEIATVRNLVNGVKETHNILLAEQLAQNGLEILKTIVLKEDTSVWQGRLSYMSGSPKTGYFHLEWNKNNNKYTLVNNNKYEGPINTRSENNESDNDPKFYRQFVIKEKESWGLYEVKSDVCVDYCDYHVKIYQILERKTS